MKILHCLGWYIPYSRGGTESYVAALAKRQHELGFTVKILVPRLLAVSYPYEVEGIVVDAYDYLDASVPSSVSCVSGREHLLDSFCSKLQGYDVFHQHSLIPACSTAHLKAAKLFGLKTIFTAHVPGVLCIRGTMLQYGLVQCKGLVSESICGSCWAQGRGLPKWFALVLARFSFTSSKVLSINSLMRFPWFRRLITLLSLRSHAKTKKQEIDCINAYADSVVAVCQWLLDGLLLNGINPSKLFLSRQGLDVNFIESLRLVAAAKMCVPGTPQPFVFGFLGRWDPLKGIDIAISAFERLPASLDARLYIVSTGATDFTQSYRDNVLEIVRRNSSILVDEDFGADAILSFFASIDALLVPSRGLETGPMVILEALAAGIPVIGSNVGGIKELSLIHDSICTLDPNDTDSWSVAMEHLATSSHSKIIPSMQVRSMDAIESEMKVLYVS